MKTRQRLDYNRLAEALGERGLVEPQTLQHILNQCLSGGGLFTELLVRENHVSDWDLARVVSEVFGLPCLTTAVYSPSLEAAEGIDIAFLHEYGIVPLDRFGKVLTVAMPCLVPTQVLVQLGEHAGVEVLPVVGSVEGNRRWLTTELPLPNALTGAMDPAGSDEPIEEGHEGVGDFALAAEALSNLDTDWGDLFDEGNAAVMLGLDGEPVEGTEGSAELSPEAVEDLEGLVESAKIESALAEETALESEGIELGSLPIPEMPALDDIPELTSQGPGAQSEETQSEESKASLELPDLPGLPEE